MTETDKSIEKLIQDDLQRTYPTFAFIGEESYKLGTRIGLDPTFIVDPIDGTSNFVHGFPNVCVSVGLVFRAQPVVGVVYNPFLGGELWTAVKGGGAYYVQPANVPESKGLRLPLSMSPLKDLSSACVGIDWGSDREGPNFDLNLAVFSTLARTVRTGGRFVNSIRCTGSAAISICRIAAGQQDIFWECGCWAWDVVAAWCILAEAGGIIVDGHPGNWSPPLDNRRYLAVRPATEGQTEIVEEFWAVIGSNRSTYGPGATLI